MTDRRSTPHSQHFQVDVKAGKLGGCGVIDNKAPHQHNELPTGTAILRRGSPCVDLRAQSAITVEVQSALEKPPNTPAASEEDGTARNRTPREEWNKQGSDMEGGRRRNVVVSSWQGRATNDNELSTMIAPRSPPQITPSPSPSQSVTVVSTSVPHQYSSSIA
ncbi:hypothetical protein V499_06679 [Pseudogymnoascus sp. VKM F-103]|uniref:Uncharacterized protein n=1 Tax=Pseudogymnoascus verrucosus TaxID=342668 RepID=A0A2P6FGV0_9PEZI|nr:uncharacterized protein VE01_10766 [Pseudogymnoascus verrucosus]KFY73220.1 hypothetical protein V499_06679 [Pseudogymnoascus sp. VKM F-103]PQM43870.1 hypothetical protein VE01_10766 [Pseudogymnoascus verrucosus]